MAACSTFVRMRRHLRPAWKRWRREATVGWFILESSATNNASESGTSTTSVDNIESTVNCASILHLQCKSDVLNDMCNCMSAHLVRYHARLRICKAKDACYLFSRMRQRMLQEFQVPNRGWCHKFNAFTCQGLICSVRRFYVQTFVQK